MNKKTSLSINNLKLIALGSFAFLIITTEAFAFDFTPYKNKINNIFSTTLNNVESNAWCNQVNKSSEVYPGCETAYVCAAPKEMKNTFVTNKKVVNNINQNLLTATTTYITNYVSEPVRTIQVNNIVERVRTIYESVAAVIPANTNNSVNTNFNNTSQPFNTASYQYVPVAGAPGVNGTNGITTVVYATGSVIAASGTITDFNSTNATITNAVIGNINSLVASATTNILTSSGSVLISNVNGVISTTSIAAVLSSTTNALGFSTSTNILSSIVNGLVATTTISELNNVKLNGTTTSENLTANNITSGNIFSNLVQAVTGLFTNLFADNATFGTTNTGNLNSTGTTNLATTNISGPLTATSSTLNGTTTITGPLVLSPEANASLAAINASNTTNTISTTTNTLQTIVNGIQSAVVSLINTFTQSVTGNTLTSVVNGVTATTSVITSNGLGINGTLLTSTVNGVATTTDLQSLVASSTSNTLTISTSTNSFTLTSIVNGVVATTTGSLINNNNLSSVINTLTSSVNGVISTSTLINSNNISTALGLITTNINGVIATTSISNLFNFLASSTNNNLTVSTTTTGEIKYTLSDNVIFTSATTTNLFTNILSAISANISNLLFGNATGTNLFVTNGSATNLSVANLNTNNTLTNSGNTLTSNVGGSIGASTIISNNSVTFATSTGVITTNVNGVISTTSLASLIAATTTNNLSFSSTTNLITSVVDGIISTTTINGLTNLNLLGTTTAAGIIANNINTNILNASTTNTDNLNFINATGTNLNLQNLVSNLVTAVTGTFQNLFSNIATFGTTNTGNLNSTGTTNLATTNISGPLTATSSTLNGTTTITGPLVLSPEANASLTAINASNTINTLTIATSTNDFTLTSTVNGKVATTSANFVNSNSLSTTTNTFATIVNGIQSAFVNIINSLTTTLSGNTLTTTVNGVSATSSVISNNSVTFATSTGIITTSVNGVISTSSLASLIAATTTNSLSFSSTTNLITSIVDGIVSTTTINGLTNLNLLGTTTAAGIIANNINTNILNASTTNTGNLSATNATTTNLIASNANITNATITNAVIGNLSSLLASSTTNTISTTTNTLQTIVNGIQSAVVNLINSFTQVAIGNTLTSTVNGVVATSSIITSNIIDFATTTNILTSNVNGVISTSSLAGVNCTGFNNIFCNGGNTVGAPLSLGSNDAQPLIFETNGFEQMRITSGGLIGIGTSAPVTEFQLAKTTSGGYDIRTDSFGQQGTFIINRSSGSVAVPTTPGNGAILGTNGFGAWDSGVNDFTTTAYTRAIIDANTGAGDLPTALTFSTTPDGTITPLERMRITSAGRFGLGNINPTAFFQVSNPFAGGPSALFERFGDTSDITFRTANGTQAAPTVVTQNQRIGRIATQGYNGTGFSNNRSAIDTLATENWTTGANGTAITFSTTPNGTNVLTQRLRIDENGNVGIGTNIPTNRLQVSGVVDPVRFEGLQTGNATNSIVIADSLGVLKTISSANLLASNTTNILSTTTNTLQTIVNGIQSAVVNLINTFTQSVTGNTLTSTVNGVTATTSIISNNNISVATTTNAYTWTTNVNGVISTTTANIINSNSTSFATSTAVLTTSINGIVSTTSLASLIAASTTNTLTNASSTNAITLSNTTNGILATTTFNIINNNGLLGLGNILTSNVNGVISTTTAVNSNSLTIATTTNNLLLTSNVNGVISTSTTSFVNSNTLSTTTNTFATLVNGIQSAFTNIINSLTTTLSGNILTTTVNGVSATSSVISSNTLSYSTSTNLLTSVINGVSTTTSLAALTNYWGLNGNTGTNALTNFIGTTDNADLNFRTNNLNRMRLSSTGKLLFNSSPDDITDTTTLANFYNNSPLLESRINLTNLSAGSTTQDGLQLTSVGLIASIQNKENGILYLGTNGAFQQMFHPNGNVGIGSPLATPGNKLEINKGISDQSGLRFTNLKSNSATTTANGRVLTVDINGDVVLVNDGNGLTTNAVTFATSTGVITTNVNGVISTTSLASLIAATTTNVISTTTNTFTSIVNGISSAVTNIINSFTQSATGNTLTSTINGVTATSSIITSNTLTNASTTNAITLVNSTNGIPATTTFNIINNNNVLSLGNVITTNVNGVISTTTAVNSNILSYATSTGLLTTNINGIIATTTISTLTTNTLAIATTTNGFTLTNTTNGVVATTSANFVNTNSISTTTNTFASIVNGVSTLFANIINSLTTTLSGNTLTTIVNGVIATSSVISSNTSNYNNSTGVLANNVNGVVSTTSLSNLVSADNGLNVSPANNVRLGGTLGQNTTVDGANNEIAFNNNSRASFIGVSTEIGGANSLSGAGSQVAIGQNNNLNDIAQYVVGSDNNLGFSNNSIVSGFGNDLNNTSSGSLYNFITGRNNILNSGFGYADNYVLGRDNNIAGGSGSNDNYTIGFNNSVQTQDSSSLLFGANTTFKGSTRDSGSFGYNNFIDAREAYTFGSNLSNTRDGNVDIGTQDGTKLTIENTGRLFLRGPLSPNGNDGGINQVLISQGSGAVPAWTNVSALLPATTNVISTTTNSFTSLVNSISSGPIRFINNNTLSYSTSTSILTSNVNGVIATTSIQSGITNTFFASSTGGVLSVATTSTSTTYSLNTTNTLATTTNTFRTIVNGVQSAITNFINSFTQSLTGNTLTTTINGVVATSSVISNNTLTSTGNVMSSNVNGVISTSTIINSNVITYATSTGVLTSVINGEVATTSVRGFGGNVIAYVSNVTAAAGLLQFDNFNIRMPASTDAQMATQAGTVPVRITTETEYPGGSFANSSAVGNGSVNFNMTPTYTQINDGAHVAGERYTTTVINMATNELYRAVVWRHDVVTGNWSGWVEKIGVTTNNIITATNGVNLASSTFKLGGGLIENTNITNSGFGLNILGALSTTTFASNGSVGFGTSTPGNLVQIASSTNNISGLRLGINASTSSFGNTSNKVLSVNAAGDVQLVTVPGTENIVEFSVNANPNTGGTTFSPAQPADADVIYSSTIDNSLWKWNGSSYVTTAVSSNFWSLVGNTVAAATRKLGTIDNFDLPFITNNIERMRILTNGNVGIGILAPAEKLDVAGKIKLSSGGATDTIYSNNTTGLALESQGNTFGTVRLTLQNISGSNGALFEQVGAGNPQLVDFGFRTVTGGQRNIRFETRAGSTLLAGGSPEFEFGIAGDPTFLTSDTVSAVRKGNFGIGTLAPANKLEITKGVANESGLRFTNLTSVSPAATGTTKFLTVDANGDVILATSTQSFTTTNILTSVNNILTNTTNGVIATSTIINNSTSTYSTSTGVLTTNINGVLATSSLSGLVTANNGLTVSAGNNVQLGGALIQNTNILAGINNLTIGGGAGTTTINDTTPGTGSVFVVKAASVLKNSLRIGLGGDTQTNGAVGTGWNNFGAQDATAPIMTVQDSTNVIKMLVAANGNVGIGTNTPGNALTVASSTGAISGLRLGINSTTATTTANGKVLTVNAAGDVVLVDDVVGGGVNVLGAPVGVNSNAATIIGNTLTLTFANATNPGIVSTANQSFAGNKTFTGATTIFNNPLVPTSDIISIEPNQVTGTQFNAKITSADLTGNQTYTLPNASGTVCLTSTCIVSLGAVTGPNSNGGIVTGGVLNLSVADNANAGIVSVTTQVFGGNKQFTGSTTFTNPLTSINSGVASSSGLRFGNLLSSSATTTANGKVLTVNAAGDVVLVDDAGVGSVTSLGVPSGSNINGATIAAGVLKLSFADTTNPGLVSTGVQSFGGDKTFASGNIFVNSGAGTNTFTLRDALFSKTVGTPVTLNTGLNTTGVGVANGFTVGNINTGMWSSAANFMNFSTNGIERMRITDIGNVGIGTTTPGNALTVASSSTFVSGLRLGINAATVAGASNGKVLSVDANGDVFLAVDASARGVDVIAAKNTALTAVMSNTAQVVIYNTETQDINAGYNNATGIYTTPTGAADTYTIEASLGFTVAGANMRNPCMAIRRAGVIVVSNCNADYNDTGGGTAGGRNTVDISGTIVLTAGQTVDIVTYVEINPTAGTVPTFEAAGTSNYFVIKRTGNAAVASDSNLKQNVQDFILGLEDILGLNTVSYKYNGLAKGAQNDGITHVGVLAQDLQNTKFGQYAVATGTDGYLRFDKDPLIFASINAIKEQNKILMGKDEMIKSLMNASNSIEILNNIKTETPLNAYEYISNRLASSTGIISDFVSARVTAIRGYFDEIFAKKIYTEILCVKKSDGTNFCANGDQLENAINYVPNNTNNQNNNSGNTSGNTGGNNTGTTTDPAPNTDPAPTTDPGVNTNSTSTDPGTNTNSTSTDPAPNTDPISTVTCELPLVLDTITNTCN